MDSGSKNIWIFAILAVGIFLIWDNFFLQDIRVKKDLNTNTVVNSPKNENIPTASSIVSKAEVINQEERIHIINHNIKGSISLRGARIDDVTLLNYKESLFADSKNVTILNPKNTDQAYFFESGWIGDKTFSVPDANTIWQSSSLELSIDNPVTLKWVNPQGIVFKKIISIDDEYMIKVQDIVENNTQYSAAIYPYALILRHKMPKVDSIFISHEGLIGYYNDAFEQVDYTDLDKKSIEYTTNKGGFLGFSDKYWLTALIPEQTTNNRMRLFNYKDNLGEVNYQIDYLYNKEQVTTNSTIKNSTNFFVGPKEYRLLNKYADEFNLPKLAFALDYGWFFFIVKPMFSFFLLLEDILENFGGAIILLTIIIRLVVFPITYKSYISMSRLKDLQPKMKALKEQFSTDSTKYNKAIMELYKKEKVNPISGCLPILLQIPIFFSLYKVIFLSIEIRHIPFWGWVQDLSAMDPTNIFNLFGLLPFNAPDFLHVGIWPILMGVTMYIQQKQTTQTMEPLQQKILMWMPVVLVFVLAKFPAALVIYWTCSNILAILQQLLINAMIKKRHVNKSKTA